MNNEVGSFFVHGGRSMLDPFGDGHVLLAFIGAVIIRSVSSACSDSAAHSPDARGQRLRLANKRRDRPPV
jgi:hypothetical protein